MGNAYLSGLDPYEGLKSVQHLLVHIHAKDIEIKQSEAERGKVQGVNDLVIFAMVTVGSLMSGTLLHHLGWETMNLLMLAPIGVVALLILWMRLNPASLPVAQTRST